MNDAVRRRHGVAAADERRAADGEAVVLVGAVDLVRMNPLPQRQKPRVPLLGRVVASVSVAFDVRVPRPQLYEVPLQTTAVYGLGRRGRGAGKGVAARKERRSVPGKAAQGELRGYLI